MAQCLKLLMKPHNNGLEWEISRVLYSLNLEYVSRKFNESIYLGIKKYDKWL